MPTLTHEDVRVVLGPVDDGLVAEIVATDASPEELAEAYAWVTNDEALMNIGRPLASSRVGRLIDILEPVEDDEAAVPAAQSH
jgi:hypothetical protein